MLKGKIMRKTVAVIAVAGALALTGCGGSVESEYLELYKAQLQDLPEGPFKAVPDDKAVELGHQACADLEESGSEAAVLINYAFGDTTERDVANYTAALNAAQETLCP